jgi:hypothetical protein
MMKSLHRSVSAISAALGITVVACVIAVACAPANECVPDVASSFALLLLAAAWFPTFIGVPGVVGFPAVAFIPNVDGVFAVAIASLPILASLSSCNWYLYVLYYTMRHMKAIELSDYLLSEWRIRETIGLLDIGSRPQSI